MRKTKVQGTMGVLFFAAILAVFLGVVQISVSSSRRTGAVPDSSGVGTLTADGTDPQPKPVPLPWLGVAA